MRTSVEMEDNEKPSFENFLSKPTTLSDHLMWQLGSLHVKDDVHRAAELVIGNLNEEGYLTATEDELLGLMDEDMGLAPNRSEPAMPGIDLSSAATSSSNGSGLAPAEESGVAAQRRVKSQ